jgi:mannosyltransferase
MSTVHAAPVRRSGAPARTAARLRLPGLWTALVVVAVALGVLARLHSPSALWLDEALSLGIARRPVPALFDALRRDGSPPLYYLLLHGWIGVFGTTPDAVRRRAEHADPAVRALSTLFSLAALPLVWLSGRRLGGRLVADAGLVLLAVSPFAVRYATETRMYALVQLLAAALLLALLRARERPSPGRLLPVAASRNSAQ